MKRWQLLLILFLIILIGLAVKLHEDPYIPIPESLLPQPASTTEGLSYTFLLGEDKENHAYFELAAKHFAQAPEEQSDVIIDHCRSLDCIVHEINRRPDKDIKKINIVSHGNPHTGLRTSILENGHRATPKRIIQATLNGDMPVFSANKINPETQINFYSCGIGQNALLTFGLKQLFKNEHGDTSQLYCSPDFVVFRYGDKSDYPLLIQSKFYPYYYQRGYRPSPSIIAQDMRRQYPDEVIDWQAAIEDTDVHEDAFHHEFHIPIRHTKIYPSKDARPDVGSTAEKMAWLQQQPEILDQLEEVNIPIDQFHWRVDKVIHTLENGKKVPAIRAIGMSTSLVVLAANE